MGAVKMVYSRDIAELKTYTFRLTALIKASSIPPNIAKIIINDVLPHIHMPLATYNRKTDTEKISYFIGAVCGRMETELIKIGINPIIIDRYKDVIKKIKL